MTDTDDATPAASATPRKRSPNFPGISLPKAIERARKVYDQAKGHPVPMSKISKDYWGYSAPTTGPATITYAALKRYGLIVDEGQGNDRPAHLTELAIEILHPNPKQEQAIQKAALSPEIFREWWDKYGDDLPPDDALNWEYVVKGPFADDGFATFLRTYRETISFAKLSKSAPSAQKEEDDEADTDVTPENEDGNSDDADGTPEKENVSGGNTGRDGQKNQQRKPQRPARQGVVTISLPLPTFGPDETVVVEFPGKLSEKDWDFFMTLIGAMKAGVVEPDRTDLQDDDPDDELE